MKVFFTVLAFAPLTTGQTTDATTTEAATSTTSMIPTTTFTSTTSSVTTVSLTTFTSTTTGTTTSGTTTSTTTTTTTTTEAPVLDGTEARAEIHSFAIEMMDLLGTISPGPRQDRFFIRRYTKLDRIFAAYDASMNCTEPYDVVMYGGSEFTDFVNSSTNSTDLCAQATLVEDSAKLWTQNYACKDGIKSRALKRWPQWLEKMNKKYC